MSMRVVLLFVLSALRPAWLLWRSALKRTCFYRISVRQVLRQTCLEGAIGFMTTFPARDEACSWYNSNSLRFT